jgi:hypothetical protein
MPVFDNHAAASRDNGARFTFDAATPQGIDESPAE